MTESAQAPAGGDAGLAAMPEGARIRHRRLAVAGLLGLAAAAILSGQFGLDLLTMDDLREAEIGREMWESGDVVIPHLAGLPFVEKPPGFQWFLALGYLVAGGPSIVVARVISAAFALGSLAAVFLTGRKLAGSVAGAISAVTLATSLTFLRTAYTVLLDNALTAALAWSLWLTWRALDSESDSRKRWFAAGALFAVGVSFLFKGFVGPAIYASGLLAWIAATRRWAEIRAFLHPLSLAAFLAPVLAWTIPFMLRASPSLQYEFFIANHFGRATSAYLSHPRPVWYYALHIWARFAPASLLLPFAVVAAWKGRRRPEGRGAHFLLCFSAGAAGLLSLSLAKDNVYLLPVYPALACLVGTWATRAVEEGRAGSGWMIALLSVVAALAIGAAITLSAKLEGPSISLGIWAAALAAGIGFLVLQLPRRDARRAGWAVAAMVAIAATMSVTPPLSTWYVAPRSIRSALQAITDGASGAELVLYRPDDQLRGGCSFYRNRTAEEIDDADALVDRLRRDPGTVAVVPVHLQVAELEPAATRAGVVLEESLRVSHAGMVPLALVRLHR